MFSRPFRKHRVGAWRTGHCLVSRIFRALNSVLCSANTLRSFFLSESYFLHSIRICSTVTVTLHDSHWGPDSSMQYGLFKSNLFLFLNFRESGNLPCLIEGMSSFMTRVSFRHSSSTSFLKSSKIIAFISVRPSLHCTHPLYLL